MCGVHIRIGIEIVNCDYVGVGVDSDQIYQFVVVHVLHGHDAYAFEVRCGFLFKANVDFKEAYEGLS